MSTKGKRPFKSIIDEMIDLKEGVKEETAKTYRSDAAVILEALMAELDEAIILNALANQGFEADAYSTVLRALSSIAKERRPLRKRG